MPDPKMPRQEFLKKVEDRAYQYEKQHGG